MNLQILPHSFKKIGLIILVVCLGVPITWAFAEGLISPFKPNEEPHIATFLMNTTISKWLDFLCIIGMMIFVLSKEKVEDDFIKKLRLESFQLTFLIGLTIALIFHLMNQDSTISLSYFIYLFMSSFLIIFAIKKRLY